VLLYLSYSSETLKEKNKHAIIHKLKKC